MSFTAAEMMMKQFHAASVIVQMKRSIHFSGKSLSTLIYDDVLDATRFAPMTQDPASLNYIFGRALLSVEHPQAKEYHRRDQRGKTKFREAFERKGRSNHPHMLKHRMAFDAYERERKIAKVIAVLEKS